MHTDWSHDRHSSTPIYIVSPIGEGVNNHFTVLISRDTLI